jgi:hypothetical protein
MPGEAIGNFAPHAFALASRYGNSATHVIGMPIDCERCHDRLWGFCFEPSNVLTLAMVPQRWIDRRPQNAQPFGVQQNFDR